SGCSPYLDTCTNGPIPAKNKGKDCRGGSCFVGDPYDPGTGINTQTEPIYKSATLALVLRYNSPLAGEAIPLRQFAFGEEWTFGYGMRVASFSGGNLGVTRPDGRYLQFGAPASGNTYVSDADVADRLTSVSSPSGQLLGWAYTVAADDSVERYDSSG